MRTASVASRTALSNVSSGMSSTRSFGTGMRLCNEIKPTGEVKDSSSAPTATPAAPNLSISHMFENTDLLHEDIHDALKSANFENFTPVQHKTLTTAGTTKSIVARARTGTGKTIAFGIPALTIALENKNHAKTKVSSLIITPTRDLALQIERELRKLTRQASLSKHRLSILSCVGGSDRLRQAHALSGGNVPDIVVGTPGRLNDLFSESDVARAFSDLRVKILDEADEMLKEGFRHDLMAVESTLNKYQSSDRERLLYLFTATVNDEVINFAESNAGNNYVYLDTVDKNEPEAHEKIDQSIINTDTIYESIIATGRSIKEAASEDPNFKAIVFLPTTASCDYFGAIFKGMLRDDKNKLIETQILHGKLTQGGRNRVVGWFRESPRGVLVTTDVGARGMDFPKVTHVFQVGPPSEAANYIHRIGRTARAGLSGKAVIFLNRSETNFKHVLRTMKIKIPNVTDFKPTQEEIELLRDVTGFLRAGPKVNLRTTFSTLLGHNRSITSNYGFSVPGVLSQLVQAYGAFGNDPTLKLPRSPAFNLPASEAFKYFETSFGGKQRASRGFPTKSRFSRDFEGRDRNAGRHSYGHGGSSKGRADRWSDKKKNYEREW